MVTGTLADYVITALDRPLPEAVRSKTSHHALDTVAAMLSGATLKPGHLALRYAEHQGGRPEAQVLGSGLLTTVTTAALTNGMLAHADETDDSHAPSLTHPGCAVVPAAWTMADREGRSGRDLLRAIALGYDVCTRVNLTITPEHLQRTQRSTYSISGTFGAMAAAAALAGLDSAEFRYALSYAAQQASGLASWTRDAEHVEKAFVFAGMPVRNGVAAVDMVANGFTGVHDVLDGETTFFGAFAPDADVASLVAGLGERYEIMNTNIKRWPVGSPIQAAVDSLLELVRAHELAPRDVRRVTARLPESGARTVDDRHMPDINLQHILAVTLLDGGLTFVASQDYARMRDPEVLDLKTRIDLVADASLNDTDPPRQAIVEIETTGGEHLVHRTYAVRGTKDNPMDGAEVERKARDLLEPILGETQCDELIDRVFMLDDVEDVRSLRPLLTLREAP